MQLTINITVSVKQKTKLDRYMTKFVNLATFPTIELYLASFADAQAQRFIKDMNNDDNDKVGDAYDAATPATQAEVNTLLGIT